MADEVAAEEEMTDEAVDVDEEAADEADSAVKDTVASREGEPGGTYTVQAGDSLSLISDDIYGEIGYWEDICEYNQLESCDAIEVGDVLQLPTLDELGTGATAPATTAKTDTAAR